LQSTTKKRAKTKDDGDSEDDFKAPNKKKPKSIPGKGQNGIAKFFKTAPPGSASSSAKSLAKKHLDKGAAAAQDGGGRGFGRERKEDLVLSEGGGIPHYIASNLKQHQVEGVKFMWTHIGGGKKPGGCILAHSMGLGKSLQICALVHAFCKRQLSRKQTARVLLVMPSSLLSNWSAEFRKWVNKPGSDKSNHINVSILSAHTATTMDARLRLLKTFHARDEGVLLVGYEMFTHLMKTYINNETKKGMTCTTLTC
jgi:SNF2 family DNA or RNA helicase